MAGSHIRAQSYCRRRCISSIWTGLGGLALLLLGAVGTAAFWQELTTGWEREPFETAALVGGLIFLLVIGIILCYVGIQNVFFPRRARSPVQSVPSFPIRTRRPVGRSSLQWSIGILQPAGNGLDGFASERNGHLATPPCASTVSAASFTKWSGTTIVADTAAPQLIPITSF